MTETGLEKWPRALAGLQERAQASGKAGPAEPGSARFHLTVTVSDAPYDVAAIDYDPREVPMSAAAKEVEDKLNDIGNAIAAEMSGRLDNYSRAAAGSILHAIFARAVKAAKIPGVTVEESFAPNGDYARYGADGAKRTDVVFLNPATEKIEGIWDWKIGRAELTAPRAKELAEHVAGTYGKPDLARSIPVRELHVDLVPGP
jgi:hypothetical protein